MGKRKNRETKQKQHPHQDKYAAPQDETPSRARSGDFDENASLDDALGEPPAPGGFEQGRQYGER